jgi:hypothetical protein
LIAELLAIVAMGSASQDVAADPTVWYFQSAACAGSATLLIPERLPASFTPAEIEVSDWERVLAEYGPGAGRSEQQIEDDRIAARDVFAELRDRDPEAFEAHREYCRLIRP